MKKVVSFFIIVFVLTISKSSWGQIKDMEIPGNGGVFSLGMRSTGSFFGNDGYPGYGVGGQFRLQLLKWLNTEWFADYITTNINSAGKRSDAHVGWSVLFYPFSNKKQQWYTPAIIMGHCFDYTKVTPLSTEIQDRSDEVVDRWSSAVQLGVANHFNLTNRFDISVNAQYMLHLGKHIHTSGHEHPQTFDVHIEDEFNFEGHLLVTVSLNYKIADLWKKQK